jgi:hypothetical protein
MYFSTKQDIEIGRVLYGVLALAALGVVSLIGGAAALIYVIVR